MQRRMPSGQGPAGRGGRARGGPRSPGRDAGPARSRSTGSSGDDGDQPTAERGRTDSRDKSRDRDSGSRTSPGRRDRPAARRGSGNAAKRTRAQQPRRLSGRATMLALILIALAFAYAYPVRVYLSQQAMIADIESAQDAQRRRITKLAEDLAKWSDDQYVIAQARRRLHYVKPGEVAYVIVEAPDKPQSEGEKATDDGPWYDQLWSNVQAADNPRQR